MFENIPNHLIEIIDYVMIYVDHETTDWFKIKRELIKLFPPRDRSNFSRRHYSSKKHILNLFDESVINYWENKMNVELWINPEKLHPSDWSKKPRGWALREFNEKRSRRKKTIKNSN